MFAMQGPTRIRVKAGTFDNYEGYILCDRAADQAVVALELFGRAVPTELERDMIEEVS